MRARNMMVALAALAAVLGCRDSTTTTMEPVAPPAIQKGHIEDIPGDGLVAPEEIELCAKWADGTTDLTKTFLTVLTDANGNDTPHTDVLAADECRVVGWFDLMVEHPADILIREYEMPGIEIVKIEVQHMSRHINPPNWVTEANTLYGTDRFTWLDAHNDDGFLVIFWNARLVGGQGCTPGYWKQPQHFDSWPAPYAPDMQFSAVFEDAFPGMTLLDVLGLNGGGLDALGRHTVAALLSAANQAVAYDLSVLTVINGFNAAYPGTKTAYNTQKDVFEGYNEQYCPLN